MAELIWVYDLNQDQIGTFDKADTIQVEEILQQSETLSFYIRADDSKASYVVEDARLRYKDRFYRISKPEHIRDDEGPAIYVEAESIFMELLEHTLRGVFDIVAATPSEGLALILTDTDWIVGTVEDDSGVFSIEETDVTVLQAVRDWATLTQREVVFDTATKQIDLVVQQGDTNGTRFSYGFNLENIKRTATPPLCTRLYAYGANNTTIATVSVDGLAYVDDFSWYTGQGISLADAQALYLKEQIWVDETYISAINLYDAALARVALLARPQLSYEMTVADLSAVTDWPADDWAIGDVVNVFDQILDVDVSARVVRLVTKPYEPYNNEIELSVLQNTIGTVSSTTSRTLTGSEFNLLVHENPLTTTVTTTQIAINSLALSFAGQGNTVIGVEFDGTASAADGELTLTYWWGTVQVGPPNGTKVPYLSGKAVHAGVPFSVVGLEGSDNFYVKAQVTSGSGTISVPAAQARLYVLASGLLGGGVSTDTTVQEVDVVSYQDAGITDSVSSISQTAQTPISITDSVSYVDAGITDSAIAVNFPVSGSDSATVTESIRAVLANNAAISDTITTTENVAATVV